MTFFEKHPGPITTGLVLGAIVALVLGLITSTAERRASQQEVKPYELFVDEELSFGVRVSIDGSDEVCIFRIFGTPEELGYFSAEVDQPICKKVQH